MTITITSIKLRRLWHYFVLSYLALQVVSDGAKNFRPRMAQKLKLFFKIQICSNFRVNKGAGFLNPG